MSAQPAGHDPATEHNHLSGHSGHRESERHLHSVDDDGAAGVHTARQDTPNTEHTRGHAGEGQDHGGGESLSDRARRAAVWAVVTFSPQSGLYTDRQPSIEETLRRARTGGQLPDAGPVRTASTVYGYAAAGVGAVCDTAKWVVAHPARLAVFSVLLALAVAFPPTREALSFLLTPAVWLHTALS